MEANGQQVIVELKDYALQSGYSALLQGVDLLLNAGESLGVVGPAGSGKSLLLKVISQSIWDKDLSGLENPTQTGKCQIFGEGFGQHRTARSVLAALQRQIVLVS